MSFQCWAVWHLACGSWWQLRSAKERGRVAPLHRLPVLLPTQANMRLDFLCSQATLLAHMWLLVHLMPESCSFLQSCFLPSHALACPVAWDCSFPPRCTSFHFLLLNSRRFQSDHFSGLPMFPKDMLFPPEHHHSLQSGSISKYEEGVLYSIIQVVNKEIKL